jgi:hypothetical protein
VPTDTVPKIRFEEASRAPHVSSNAVSGQSHPSRQSGYFRTGDYLTSELVNASLGNADCQNKKFV